MDIIKSVSDIFGKAYKEVDYAQVKKIFLEDAKRMYDAHPNRTGSTFVLYSSNEESNSEEQQVYIRTRYGADRTIFQLNEIYIDGSLLCEIYNLLFEDGMFAEVRIDADANKKERVVVERDNGKFVEVLMKDLPIRKCSVTSEKIVEGMECASDKDMPSYKIVYEKNEKQ